MLLWQIYVADNNKNVRRSSRNVPDIALKHKNVCLLMAFLELQFD